MPQLRQLTIDAEDPVLLAGFYQDVFQLEKIGEHGAGCFFPMEVSTLRSCRYETVGREV
ncbi:MAG TPA: hypothetical protein VE616_12010 [Candidatus Udaeobacter sp.]|jgi:hypothetical protein|nr:hypothetical protein [Candidatus Udaeobacter sp.]